MRRDQAARIPSAALAGILILGTISPLIAGIAIGDSLDWLVVASDQVAIAQLFQTTDEQLPPPAVVMDRTYEMKVIRTLKGRPFATTRFVERIDRGRPHMATGKEFLLFCNGESRVAYAINLSSPSEAAGYRGQAFTIDFNILTTREAILASVTKRLERLQRERPLGFLTLDIPGDKPAYRALWGGSACFLRVPADREFKDKFIQDLRSKDVALRARAAHHLAKYPGRDTVELLKPLLQDPGTQLIQGVSSDKGKYEFTIYPVRQAAYKVLQTWGIDVPKPAGYREDYSGFFLD